MSGAKGFLIGFALVYVTLASVGLYVWGPPGYSDDYLAEHKARHEQYLVITKSTDYKQYMQQGDAAPDDPALIEKAAFVDEYVESPDFAAESKRLAIYGYYFGFLNAGGLMLIAYRFGRAPITALLDAQIAEVRAQLDRSAMAKAEAGERLAAAQSRISGLEADQEQANAAAAEFMDRERDLLEQGTANALSFIDQETEERKHIVELQAIKTLRAELVEQAARVVLEAYQARRNTETEIAQIDAFVAGLTGRVTEHTAPESVAK